MTDAIDHRVPHDCSVKYLAGISVGANGTRNVYRMPQLCLVLRRTVVMTDGCWLSTATVTNHGYVRVRNGGSGDYAHRVTYRAWYGEIADGLQIDHLCRVRNCVNPRHLEAVTPSVNVTRGLAPLRSWERAAERTHCPAGHEFSEENTGYGRTRAGFQRVCRECVNSAKRARRLAHNPDLRQRAKVAACGTLSGFKRHKDRTEDVCGPCQEAMRAYNRHYYLRKTGRAT